MRLAVIALLFCVAFSCETFNGEMSCQSGEQTGNPESWSTRIFQTPDRGTDLWKDQYEDLSKIACFTDITYNSGRESAEVDIFCKTHPDVDGLVYVIDGVEQEDSTFTADGSVTAPLQIVVEDTSGDYSITLPDVDFVWNAPKIEQDSVYEGG